MENKISHLFLYYYCEDMNFSTLASCKNSEIAFKVKKDLKNLDISIH